LLNMIRFGSLVELSVYTGSKNNSESILQEIENIENHCEKIKDSLKDD